MIKSGAIEIDVQMIKVTLRTFEKLSEWKKRLIAHSTAVGQTEAMIKLAAKIPELAEMVTSSGNFRDSYLTEQEKIFGDRDTAMQKAQEKILMIATENPDVAKTLFYPEYQFGNTVESLKVGIECIKETCDINLLDKKNLKYITSDISTDFWQDVESEGVIDYCEKFCQSIK